MGERKMSIEKEIERAVKRTIALDKDTPYKSAAEQEKIISDIKSAFNDATFHFENSKSLMLNQSGKKRLVKQYDNLYSPENILCQSIKQILDRAFKIKYPNRNKTTRTLFSVLSAAIQMSDFTIVKFDFKDYFNSVSSIYVFEKYLKYNILDRHEIDLIKAFAYSTKYAYAGLCTSNAIAEIIAGYFDEAVKQMFFSNGIIYYERYIDDSILILNEHMEETEVKEKLETVLLKIFHDQTIKAPKCHTKFNKKKFKYISRRNILKGSCSVDFLGYEFWLSANGKAKIEIKYKACFDSIYTHAFTWIIERNVVDAKDAVNSHLLVTIDRILQNINGRSSNGIVVGPEFSRMMAEVLLQHIDNVKVTIKLTQN